MKSFETPRSRVQPSPEHGKMTCQEKWNVGWYDLEHFRMSHQRPVRWSHLFKQFFRSKAHLWRREIGKTFSSVLNKIQRGCHPGRSSSSWNGDFPANVIIKRQSRIIWKSTCSHNTREFAIPAIIVIIKPPIRAIWRLTRMSLLNISVTFVIFLKRLYLKPCAT